MIKEYTKLDNWFTAKRDRVFKAVFVNDKDKRLLECILRETLNKSVNIVKFHITELAVKTVSERVKMLDVLIEIDNNKFILCEINTSFSTVIRERNLMFLEAFSSQRVKRGEKYRKINEIYLINYNFIADLGGPIIRHFTYRDEDGKKYSNSRMIINVNMDKLLKNYYNNGGKDAYKHLAMLDMAQKSLHDLAQEDEIASMYYNKLMELNTDQEFVQLLSNDDEYELYVESEINEAREDAHKEGVKEGIDIGKTQGSKESKLEIANAMLNNHEDLEKIMTYTSLTKDEILNLKNTNN